jgi:hypothetical protein
MTISSENLGNGSAKIEERFAGQLGYRPRSSRDNALPANPLDHVVDELGPRSGLSGIDRLTTPLDIAAPIASTLTHPRLSESSLVELREPSYAERSFAPDPWADAPASSVAEHPLLRGLLLELPPKGTTMHAQWLDRWFEAARSILELLYRFDSPVRD